MTACGPHRLAHALSDARRRRRTSDALRTLKEMLGSPHDSEEEIVSKLVQQLPKLNARCSALQLEIARLTNRSDRLLQRLGAMLGCALEEEEEVILDGLHHRLEALSSRCAELEAQVSRPTI